ncbi:DnaJ-like protein subfamily C member 13 [Hypsibius exemplaris]|uniref:DnaJ-like protein subfamily C member 13 n=1 Tax=Hypsibius exemplaris TaxID=2072580 RepID=A0A1W0WRH4_HYPEX|nr:DnaJ-like protein subfamily C member 13 [Hypsibius exemplaris]
MSGASTELSEPLSTMAEGPVDGNDAVCCYFVTKHSWMGKYRRVFSIGTKGITVYNPGSCEKTNHWAYSDIMSILPARRGQGGTEFILTVRKGKKGDTLKFSSDHRTDVLTECLRYRDLFAGQTKARPRYNAFKHHWSDKRVPVVLEVGYSGLIQHDQMTGTILTSYDYRDIAAIALVSDYPGGFCIFSGGFERLHLFVSVSRDAILRDVVEAGSQFIGLRLTVRTEPISFERFSAERFGKYSTIEATASLCEFMVQKLTHRAHKGFVRRTLCLSKTCLVERDPATYAVCTVKPLGHIFCIVRHAENPKLFGIKYVNGQTRTYSSTDRDSLIARLIDGIWAAGNRDIHVKMFPTMRDERLDSFTLPVDEEVESQHLKFLRMTSGGVTFPEVRQNDFLDGPFNPLHAVNTQDVSYSGPVHSATQDSSLAEKKERSMNSASLAVEGDVGFDKSHHNDGAAYSQSLRRYVSPKKAFAAFTAVPAAYTAVPLAYTAASEPFTAAPECSTAASPPFPAVPCMRETIASRVLKALAKSNDDAITHAAPPTHTNANWFAGRGSVRALVRDFEAQKSTTELCGRAATLEQRKTVSMVQIGGPRLDAEENRKVTSASAPLASTSDSSSTEGDCTPWPAKPKKSSSGASKSDCPILSPPPPPLFAAPTAPPVVPFDQFPILPPPSPPPPPPLFAAPTAPPVVPFDQFPILPPPSPPPPPHSDELDFVGFANFPPPPPPPPPPILRVPPNVDSTESDEKNDDSTSPDSSPHMSSLSPMRGPFSPPTETYFIADGEGPNHFNARPQPDRSENSERSRMGDFRSVETAVEKMAARLKANRSTAHAKRLQKSAAAAPIRMSPQAPQQQRTDDEELFARGDQYSRRIYMQPDTRHSEPPPREMKNELQHFHDQLDEILRNGDEEVSYTRFQDPFPLYDSAVKQPAAPVRSRPVAISTPSIRPETKSDRSRQDQREGFGVDLVDTRRQALRFDSVSSGSTSEYTTTSGGRPRSSSSRKSTKQQLVRSVRQDVSTARNGEVVLSIDARSGYEFTSTISLRTDDLSRYSVSQSQKEIRTGKIVSAKRFDVFGFNGVTQEMLIDRPRGHLTRSRNRGTHSLDESLPSLSYDFQSDGSDLI